MGPGEAPVVLQGGIEVGDSGRADVLTGAGRITIYQVVIATAPKRTFARAILISAIGDDRILHVDGAVDVVVDAAAALDAGGVAIEGAIADIRRVIVVDAAAIAGGRVAGEGAIADVHRVIARLGREVIDATADGSRVA